MKSTSTSDTIGSVCLTLLRANAVPTIHVLFQVRSAYYPKFTPGTTSRGNRFFTLPYGDSMSSELNVQQGPLQGSRV